MDLPFIFLLLGLTAASPVPLHPNKVILPQIDESQIFLPGAPLLPEFNLFSGYLNGSSDHTSIPIFYVLAESIRVDPSTAPLLIWFNGGPGASSLAAFFKEHGPYRITESGDVLAYNEFSWNQYANVLYLESPLGVGFSQNEDGNMTTNDRDAANLNFYAIRDFMTRVHPNYADRNYYLSGQSYAGTYVPYLARRLLEGIKSNELENENFKFGFGTPIHSNFVEHCYNKTYQTSYHAPTDETSINCFGKHVLKEYLNRVDVQNALHVRNVSVGATIWEEQNLKFGGAYTGDYYVFPVYDDIFELVNDSSFRVLVYHGDTDLSLSPVHTINSTTRIAERNSLEKQKDERAWRFYGDFAGIRNAYRDGSTTMDVITVRGAGHSVPTDLPAQAFQMINNFLFTEKDEHIDYSIPIRKH